MTRKQAVAYLLIGSKGPEMRGLDEMAGNSRQAALHGIASQLEALIDQLDGLGLERAAIDLNEALTRVRDAISCETVGKQSAPPYS